MQGFVDYLITLVKGLMAPAMTVAAVVVFTILSLNGKLDIDRIFWIILGVFAFWMGDRFINKYVAPPKANGQTVAAQTVSPSNVTEPVTEEDTYDPDYITPEPILFSPVSFKQDVEGNVAGDYVEVNPTTLSNEASGQIRAYWNSKINNNVAKRDMLAVILDYAKKAMAFEWTKFIGKDATPEFDSDPIKYVNDHFGDFRNCPSCKQLVADQLVDIDWLADSLSDTGTRTSYENVLDAQEEYDNVVQAIATSGLVTWIV